jgi:hypothetical protein
MQTHDRKEFMSQSGWYHDRAAECDRMALASRSRLPALVIWMTVIDGGRLPPVLMRLSKL